MENENESEEKKPPLDPFEQEQIESIYKRADINETIKKELHTEERFVNFFSGYNPISVEQFIESYAIYKSMWWNSGEHNIRSNEAEDLQWINAAQEHLDYLQQKKLFDVQCLWRAEKVTIPEIELSKDFMVWERNVLHCPFIDPITEDDIRLYQQYLNQSNVDIENYMWDSWQDYNEIKEAYATDNANRNFPEWYDFHSGRAGTGVYLTLPDIRGEKESFYINLAREKTREENRENAEEFERTRDRRPMLSYYDKEQLDFFVSTFEDKDTIRYYKAYSRSHRNNDLREEMENILSLLLDAEEPVPIEAHYDFREALRRANERYHARMIAEFMPQAFEQYELNRSMGFAMPEEAVTEMKNWMSIRNTWRDLIIKGRVLNGEPADLNF